MVIQWIKDYLEKVRSIMAVVYVTLIINGKKEFGDVPKLLKDKVKELLIDLDLKELIQE